MADELATDTTNLATDEAAALEAQGDTAKQPEAVDAKTPEASDTEAGGDDGTVLGGKPKEAEGDAPKADDADAPKEDAPEGAPEAYELKLEGTNLDADAVADAEPLLREANLTNEQANTILPAAQKLVERTQDNMMQQLADAGAQQKADWLKIAKADEEIGGAKWDETTHLAAKGLDALGFKEGHAFRETLNETGFGNNRDVIFAFRKVGELVGEDGFVRGDPAAPVTDAKSTLYPNG